MSKSKVVKVMVLVIIGAAIFVLGGWLLVKDRVVVNDFESCVRAGNPVRPVVPGECMHNGKLYSDTNSPYLPRNQEKNAQ